MKARQKHALVRRPSTGLLRLRHAQMPAHNLDDLPMPWVWIWCTNWVAVHSPFFSAPPFGNIVKACAPDFSSSLPVLIVSCLEVSVSALSARVLIRKLILTQPVCSSCCISDPWIYLCSCEATNVQIKIPSEIYFQFWKNFPCFSLVKDLTGTGDTA